MELVSKVVWSCLTVWRRLSYHTNQYYFKGGSGALASAMELLSKASNPVIVSGGGVVMSDGVAEVVKLAEKLQEI